MMMIEAAEIGPKQFLELLQSEWPVDKPVEPLPNHEQPFHVC